MSTTDRLIKRTLRLPQVEDTWLLVVRPLRSWIQGEDEVHRAWTILCMSSVAGTILGNELALGRPETDEVLKTVLGFMLEPAPHSIDHPCRPARIAVEDQDLARELRARLKPLGVAAAHVDLPDEVDVLLADIESVLRRKEEIPGLLEGEGVTPAIVGAFFQAAAHFYRAEPWIALSNTQTLAISFPPDPATWFVTIMGQGGVEYGLVLQRTWKQVQELFHSLDDPLEGMPTEGWHSVSFEPAYGLPFADLDAIEAYDWEVAAEDAYPLPAIFDREGALRPPGDELLLWEQVMRAVIAFFPAHLEPDGMGDYQPVEAELNVEGLNGPILATVRYPAGVRDPGHRSYHDLSSSAELAGAPSAAAPRMIGSFLLDVVSGWADPDLERAQRLIYKAWEQPDKAERIRLAEQALRISPNCADAYVLLAEQKAKTVREAFEFYERGMAAGRAALADLLFEEGAGNFCAMLETRPYMRARYGLANSLWKLERPEEAEGHYRALLKLNPNDNQGVRYTLLHLLMETGRDDEALDLIDEYDSDPSAMITFNRALLEYREQGRSEIAEASLQEALDYNPHLAPYLLGEKRLPRDPPLRIGFGDENEAIDYAATFLNHWRATAGALDWLRDYLNH